MPKQLLLIIGGLVLASCLVVAGLIAFLLPPDILAPTTAERAEEREAAEAEAEAGTEGDDDGGRTGEDGSEPDAPGQEDLDATEDAPGGGGPTDGGTDGDAAEPGGEDTGEIRGGDSAGDAEEGSAGA